MSQDLSYIGIDVGKQWLDAATTQRHLGQFSNNPLGHGQLITRLRRLRPRLIAIEASGGYQRPVVASLIAAGLSVAVVQPARVRHFAKSIMLHAKTDKIDALLIARFAHATQPTPTEPAGPDVAKLRALQDRRSQVVGDRTREQNRIETCPDKAVCKRIQQSIRRLDKEIAALDKQIKACINASDELARRHKLLCQAVGIADVNAATLLAHLPELGRVNRQQVASLAGLAPYAQDSGKRKGKRKIFGGRGQVRRALYMAALSAIRFDPVLRGFYQQLREAGKLFKVAIIAVARKLLIHLNTRMARMLKQTTPTPPAGVSPA